MTYAGAWNGASCKVASGGCWLSSPASALFSLFLWPVLNIRHMNPKIHLCQESKLADRALQWRHLSRNLGVRWLSNSANHWLTLLMCFYLVISDFLFHAAKLFQLISLYKLLNITINKEFCWQFLKVSRDWTSISLMQEVFSSFFIHVDFIHVSSLFICIYFF